MTRLDDRGLLGILALTAATSGCGAPPEDAIERSASPIVYGGDDRREFFETHDSNARARMSRSMVALVPKAWASKLGRGEAASIPSYGSVDELCDGERFANQPAAAFCSGVLVDWDLVLTAAHCIRRFALGDFKIVFGYYYTSLGK